MLLFSEHFPLVKLEYIILKLEVRYIDDIYEIWCINKNMFSLNDIELIKQILRDDKGIRYLPNSTNQITSIIKLKSSVKVIETYLDLNIRYDHLRRKFTTSIHKKSGKLNTLLVDNSNNSMDHFYGVYQSHRFRSICK